MAEYTKNHLSGMANIGKVVGEPKAAGSGAVVTVEHNEYVKGGDPKKWQVVVLFGSKAADRVLKFIKDGNEIFYTGNLTKGKSGHYIKGTKFEIIGGWKKRDADPVDDDFGGEPDADDFSDL